MPAALKKWLARGILLASPLIIFSLVEVWLRSDPELDTRFNFHNKTHQILMTWSDFKVFYNLEPLGPERVLVGRTHTVKPPDGRKRILSLGSSSTFGHGASNESLNTYPRALERELNRRLGGGYEVINGGICGASLSVLRLYLRHELLQFKPDLVLLYFGGNDDTHENRQATALMEADREGTAITASWDEIWATVFTKSRSPLVRGGFLRLAHLRSFMALIHLWEVHAPASWRGGARDRERDPSSWRSSAMAHTTAEIIELCKARGIPLLLVPEVGNRFAETKPNHKAIDLARTSFKALAAENRSHGVHFGRVDDRFTPPLLRRYFEDHVHMNDEGYTFLASLLADLLEQKGLVNRRPEE